MAKEKQLERKLEPIIAKLFKEWEAQANSEELQEFCDSVNNSAAVLRNFNKIHLVGESIREFSSVG